MTGVEADKDSNYGHAHIHLEMIQDESRTMTYCEAIEQNADQFQGKVVLDIGSGTGILSLMAARAGARLVYSVECSPISSVAQQIINDNGYSDRITVIPSRLEDISMLEQVDVVISEWMGYSLCFELMLSSVIRARDRYLKPDGLLLPSNARLHLVGVQSSEYRVTSIDFWDSTYGFNFAAMKKLALSEPVIDRCEDWQIATNSQCISDIDLHYCDINASFFTSEFALTVNRADILDAFVTWFEVFFNDMPMKKILTTSPVEKETHWKQTFFYLENAFLVREGDLISGTISFAKNEKDSSGLSVRIEYTLNAGPSLVQEYDFR